MVLSRSIKSVGADVGAPRGKLPQRQIAPMSSACETRQISSTKAVQSDSAISPDSFITVEFPSGGAIIVQVRVSPLYHVHSA